MCIRDSVWRQADTYNVPRMAFINKMDILGADFYNAVEQIKTRLGKNAICIQLPIGKEDEFKGIIDLFEMKAYIYNDEKGDDISIVDIPEDMKEEMCIRDRNIPKPMWKKAKVSGEVLSNKYLPNAMQRTLFSQIIGKGRRFFSSFPLKPG